MQIMREKYFVNHSSSIVLILSFYFVPGGCTLCNDLYGEAPPEKGTFFRLQVHERVGILLVEVYERVGKSVIWVCERAQRANRRFLWLSKVEKTFYYCDRLLCKRQWI